MRPEISWPCGRGPVFDRCTQWDLENAFVERAHDKRFAIDQQRTGEETRCQHACELPAPEFRHAHRGAHKGPVSLDRQGKNARIGQPIGLRKAVGLARVPVDDAIRERAYPEVRVVPRERRDVQIRKLGMER